MKPRIQEAAQKSQWALHVSLICRGGYIKTAERTGCGVRDSDTEGLPKHHRLFWREGLLALVGFQISNFRNTKDKYFEFVSIL